MPYSDGVATRDRAPLCCPRAAGNAPPRVPVIRSYCATQIKPGTLSGMSSSPKRCVNRMRLALNFSLIHVGFESHGSSGVRASFAAGLSLNEIRHFAAAPLVTRSLLSTNRAITGIHLSGFEPQSVVSGETL